MADTLADALIGWLTDCRLILSSAFARALGRRDALVSLGRYALCGVAAPQELFTPDPTATGA